MACVGRLRNRHRLQDGDPTIESVFQILLITTFVALRFLTSVSDAAWHHWPVAIQMRSVRTPTQGVDSDEIVFIFVEPVDFMEIF